MSNKYLFAAILASAALAMYASAFVNSRKPVMRLASKRPGPRAHDRDR